jgi:hypothetical protein
MQVEKGACCNVPSAVRHVLLCLNTEDAEHTEHHGDVSGVLTHKEARQLARSACYSSFSVALGGPPAPSVVKQKRANGTGGAKEVQPSRLVRPAQAVLQVVSIFLGLLVRPNGSTLGFFPVYRRELRAAVTELLDPHGVPAGPGHRR